MTAETRRTAAYPKPTNHSCARKESGFTEAFYRAERRILDFV